jgi:hypothetical protein
LVNSHCLVGLHSLRCVLSVPLERFSLGSVVCGSLWCVVSSLVHTLITYPHHHPPCVCSQCVLAILRWNAHRRAACSRSGGWHIQAGRYGCGGRSGGVCGCARDRWRCSAGSAFFHRVQNQETFSQTPSQTPSHTPSPTESQWDHLTPLDEKYALLCVWTLFWNALQDSKHVRATLWHVLRFSFALSRSSRSCVSALL